MGQDGADRPTLHVGGNVTGQVVVGNQNVQHWQQTTVSGPATAEDLAELRAALAELRASLTAEAATARTAQTEQTDGAALAKVDELEEALTGDQVDVATVEHVHGWFRRKLPAFAQAVNRIVLSPFVERLVAAGGDELAAEFARRLG